VYEVMLKLAKERKSAIEENKMLRQVLVWNLFGIWNLAAIFSYNCCFPTESLKSYLERFDFFVSIS